ncbi:MAG: hypothetical protein ACE5R6_04555 [Candidatus Heimdallarchaeota archaeon]
MLKPAALYQQMLRRALVRCACAQTHGIYLHVRGTDRCHTGDAGLGSLPTVADDPTAHCHHCVHLAILQECHAIWMGVTEDTRQYCRSEGEDS